MKYRFALLVAICCLGAAVVGCSKGPKKPDDLPSLNPTTITVTYDDGTPVDGATVALLPVEKQAGRAWNLTGKTDANGTVTLKTDGNWDGAPSGVYNVIVTKEVSEVEEPTEKGGSSRAKSVTRLVDQKYANPKTSGLTVEIQAGTNDLEVKVGEKVSEDVETVE